MKTEISGRPKLSVELRDKMLKVGPYNCGIARFENASFKTLQELVALGFLDPRDRQNNSPDAGTIIRFMEKYPRFKAHGYVVAENRGDCRTTIEGVELKGRPRVAEIVAFFNLFSDADELEISEKGLSCWYD